MAKKRKQSSIASFVRHLETCSSDKINSNKPLNLSAYHPHLDPSLLTDSDYTSLVPHSLVHPSHFPPPLLKYWRHRFSLFSLYSSGCLLDEQSWYSITPESVAFRIAKRCATDNVILDLFAGAGGNAIQFAITCAKVIAVEIDPLKLRLARWNANVYGVEDRIDFVNADCLDLLRWWEERRSRKGGKDERERERETWNGIRAKDLDQVEAVFLSPPWGGVEYATHPPTTTDASESTPSSSSEYSLASIQPLDGRQLFHRVSSAFQTCNIAYYLPRNTSLTQLAELSSQPQKVSQAEPNEERVKIEYQYVNYGTKLSSLTAYFGDLATEWDDEIDDWKRKPSSSSSSPDSSSP